MLHLKNADLLTLELKAAILKPLHWLITPKPCSRVYSILSRDLSLSTSLGPLLPPLIRKWSLNKFRSQYTCSLLGNWLDRKAFILGLLVSSAMCCRLRLSVSNGFNCCIAGVIALALAFEGGFTFFNFLRLLVSVDRGDFLCLLVLVDGGVPASTWEEVAFDLRFLTDLGYSSSWLALAM